jgi:GH43 family beta-xylosidase
VGNTAAISIIIAFSKYAADANYCIMMDNTKMHQAIDDESSLSRYDVA